MPLECDKDLILVLMKRCEKLFQHLLQTTRIFYFTSLPSLFLVTSCLFLVTSCLILVTSCLILVTLSLNLVTSCLILVTLSLNLVTLESSKKQYKRQRFCCIWVSINHTHNYIQRDYKRLATFYFVINYYIILSHFTEK